MSPKTTLTPQDYPFSWTWGKRPPRLVIFDLDNTLYPTTPAIDAMFSQAYGIAAAKLHDGSNGGKLRVDAAVREGAESYGRGVLGFEHLSAAYGLGRPDLHHEAHRAFEAMVLKCSKKGRPPIAEDSVLAERLEALKSAGVQVAVLTHGSTQWAHKALSMLGVDNLFDHRLVAGVDDEDLQLRMKDKHQDVFHTMLERVNAIRPPKSRPLRFRDVVMVEDSLANLKIPKELGMTPVLLRGEEVRRPYREKQREAAKSIAPLEFYNIHDCLGSLLPVVQASRSGAARQR